MLARSYWYTDKFSSRWTLSGLLWKERKDSYNRATAQTNGQRVSQGPRRKGTTLEMDSKDSQGRKVPNAGAEEMLAGRSLGGVWVIITALGLASPAAVIA